MNKYKIEKYDNKGRGICYVNSKITFVAKTLPDDLITLKIIKENKKYNEATIVKIIENSPLRIQSPCPYFNYCGGCSLLNTSYENTLNFKREKITNILKKYANIDQNIEIIPSPKILNYRNKITLKINNNKIGYYEPSSHSLVEIKQCLLAEEPINNFIKDIKYLHIENGELVIRTNYNSELLIWIKSNKPVYPDITYLKQIHKIAGIVLNEKTIYGESYFMEIINHHLFKVSYDSFFQINRHICSKIFDITSSYIDKDDIILDLYCGVGTLGINVSSKIKKAYGIEIVKNAVLNAITNSKINKSNNILYMLGNVSDCLPKIKDNINTIIVDPPRAGLDKVTIETIIRFKPSKIIYVSCDIMTLSRDLTSLSPYYEIKKITALDMFPYTYHVECISVLSRKSQ